MITRIKGIKIVRAPSGKVYYYHRKSGKKIDIDPKVNPVGFNAEVNRLNGTESAPNEKVTSLGALIRAYKSPESPEWNNLAPRTKSDYNMVFNYLVKLDAMPLRQIDGPFVIGVRDKAYRKRKRRFANYVVQVLRLLLNWGIPRGYVTTNPALSVELIRRPRGTRKVNRAWSDAERQIVLARATGGLRRGIALGAFAALREGDMVKFSRASYTGQEVAFTAGKNTEPVWMPAHSALRQILDEVPKDQIRLTLNTRGKPYTESGFRAVFFKLIRDLVSEGLVQPGLTFHGLRHTVGKLLDEAGCDPKTIAAVLGDRSEAMAKLYSEEGDKKRRTKGAVKKLERQWNKSMAKTADKSGKNSSGS